MARPSPPTTHPRAEVLQPMERRATHVSVEESAPEVQVRRRLDEPVSAWMIGVRAARWAAALVRFGALVALDAARGRRGMSVVASRLREVFERLGGTALKLGQQLAVRVDFLPFELCQELERLLDKVPPFEVAYAITRVEATTGRPFAADFASIEPEPIGSASIACVFRAKLLDGTPVAIKVRRAEVERSFRADLATISIMTRMAELFTFVRGGFFRHLRTDLEEMFIGELDLTREANFQSAFRRDVRRDRIQWLDAPKVYTHLCGDDVLVTRFVEGYSLATILRAIETQDPDAITTLRAADIDPEKIGLRLVQISLWSRLECAFFHADPHPGNILVGPGGTMTLLDFGCCAFASRRQAEVTMEMSRRLLQDDIAGGAALSLMAMAPLPLIDLVEYRRRAESTIWDSQLQMKSKGAEWWERTSAAMWLKLLEAVREMNVPVTMDVLRLTRATLLYDSVALRLNHQLTFNDAYQAWLKGAAKRARKRYSRRRLRAIGVGDRLRREVADLREAAARGAFLLSQTTNALPAEYTRLVSKGAFAISALMRFLLVSLGLVIAGLSLQIARAWMVGGGMDLRAAARAALASPVTLVVIFTVFSWFFLQIRSRLNDADPR